MALAASRSGKMLRVSGIAAEPGTWEFCRFFVLI